MIELLRIEDVAKITKISSRTLRRWEYDGKMPEPTIPTRGFKSGRQLLRWRSDVIEKWLLWNLPDRKAFARMLAEGQQ